MAMVAWTPAFSVGVDSLDADHRMLISLLNQLDEAVRRNEPRETVRRVLDGLLDYSDYHFAREEALMTASGYPDLDAHVRTHRTLRAQVADIRDRYVRNPESIHAREVLIFLKNWLSAHILGRDKLYQPFMAGARDAVIAADRAYTERAGERVAVSAA